MIRHENVCSFNDITMIIAEFSFFFFKCKCCNFHTKFFLKINFTLELNYSAGLFM